MTVNCYALSIHSVMLYWLIFGNLVQIKLFCVISCLINIGTQTKIRFNNPPPLADVIVQTVVVLILCVLCIVFIFAKWLFYVWFLIITSILILMLPRKKIKKLNFASRSYFIPELWYAILYLWSVSPSFNWSSLKFWFSVSAEVTISWHCFFISSQWSIVYTCLFFDVTLIELDSLCAKRIVLCHMLSKHSQTPKSKDLVWQPLVGSNRHILSRELSSSLIMSKNNKSSRSIFHGEQL